MITPSVRPAASSAKKFFGTTCCMMFSQTPPRLSFFSACAFSMLVAMLPLASYCSSAPDMSVIRSSSPSWPGRMVVTSAEPMATAMSMVAR